MEIIDEPRILPQNSIVASIGMYDGVHLGHQLVISQVREIAAKRDLKSAIISFKEHPRSIVHPEADPTFITSLKEREALLESYGIDYLILLHFTPEMAKLTAKQFISLIHYDYGVNALITGYDNRFGRNRAEGFEDYVRYGELYNMDVLRAPEYHGEYQPVSSTIIRSLLLEGNVEEAALKLSRPYHVRGIVKTGYQLGRTIGFPTANIVPHYRLRLMLPSGVYATRITLPNGNIRFGMTNIGTRPTVSDSKRRTIETYIFDFDDDIYGKEIIVEFLKYVRPERKMSGVEELKSQLAIDEKQIRAIHF